MPVVSILALVAANPAAAQEPADAGVDGALLDAEPVHLPTDVRETLLSPFTAMGLDAERVLESVVLRRITYASDGLRVRGYIAEPRDGGRFPAIILNRGGNRDFGALDDAAAAFLMAPLAAEGYVVVASQYRGNAGGEGREEFGGADVNDVLNLIPLLEGFERADASRIGMYGWSRGGLMTYLALARTDRIAAAAVGGGAADAFRGVADRPEMETQVLAELVPEWTENREAELLARSPARWADRLHQGTPILILHGGADWRVSPLEAIDMARALQEEGRYFRLILYEGGDHGLTQFRFEVHRAVAEWMNRFVRDGETPSP